MEIAARGGFDLFYVLLRFSFGNRVIRLFTLCDSPIDSTYFFARFTVVDAASTASLWGIGETSRLKFFISRGLLTRWPVTGDFSDFKFLKCPFELTLTLLKGLSLVIRASEVSSLW